jgi:hypothetical protein
MYIQRIDTLTSKDKEKVLNSKRTTYLIQGGGDFGLYSNSNLPITLKIIESIEAVHSFNLFLNKIDKDPLPTAPLYNVLKMSLEGKELTYSDKIDLLDLFATCWQWYDKFYTIHDDLKLVPQYEVIYFACGLLCCSEYENDKIISRLESRLIDLLYNLGNENILKCEFLDKIDEIINQPTNVLNIDFSKEVDILTNQPTNETE